MPQRLTAEYLHQLPAAPLKAGKTATVDVPDSGRGAVAGLRLRVTSGGAKSWVFSPDTRAASATAASTSPAAALSGPGRT